MNTAIFDQDKTSVQTLIEQFSSDCKDRNLIPQVEVQNFLLDLYNLMNNG